MAPPQLPIFSVTNAIDASAPTDSGFSGWSIACSSRRPSPPYSRAAGESADLYARRRALRHDPQVGMVEGFGALTRLPTSFQRPPPAPVCVWSEKNVAWSCEVNQARVDGGIWHRRDGIPNQVAAALPRLLRRYGDFRDWVRSGAKTTTAIAVGPSASLSFPDHAV